MTEVAPTSFPSSTQMVRFQRLDRISPTLCKTVTAFQACHWGGVGQTTVTNNFTAERVA